MMMILLILTTACIQYFPLHQYHSPQAPAAKDRRGKDQTRGEKPHQMTRTKFPALKFVKTTSCRKRLSPEQSGSPLPAFYQYLRFCIITWARWKFIPWWWYYLYLRPYYPLLIRKYFFPFFFLPIFTPQPPFLSKFLPNLHFCLIPIPSRLRKNNWNRLGLETRGPGGAD